ncbi:O-antigen ligase family protein [Vibrio breoganii]
MSNLKQTISDNLLYIPLLWIATGMFGVDKGDKILLIVVAVCTLVSLLINKLSIIKHNWNNNPWIKWLIALIVFGVISDLIHGFGSRELRALETAALFLLCIDHRKLNVNIISILIIIASLSALLITTYFQISHPTNRQFWPVNAIPYGSYITLIICLCLLMIPYTNRKTLKALLFISAFIGLSALFLTKSRGPLVALICTLTLIGFYTLIKYRINWRLVTIGLTCIIVTSIATLPYLQERYERTIEEINLISSGNYQTSIGVRLSVYSIGLDMIIKKPVFGYGKDALPKYLDRMLEDNLITSVERLVLSWNFHNNFIEKGVVSGLVGVASMFLWLGLPLVYGWKNHRQHFMLLSIPPLLYFFACLTDTPATNGSSYVTYLMFVGLVIAYLSNSKHNRDSEIRESSLA